MLVKTITNHPYLWCVTEPIDGNFWGWLLLIYRHYSQLWQVKTRSRHTISISLTLVADSKLRRGTRFASWAAGRGKKHSDLMRARHHWDAAGFCYVLQKVPKSNWILMKTHSLAIIMSISSCKPHGWSKLPPLLVRFEAPLIFPSKGHAREAAWRDRDIKKNMEIRQPQNASTMGISVRKKM